MRFDQIAELSTVEDESVRNHLVTLAFRDLSRVLLGYTHYPDREVPDLNPELELGRRGDELVRRASGFVKRRTRREERESLGTPTPIDANFCTFGLWASLTIGRNVRNRFAPRRFDSGAPNAVRGLFNRLAIDVRRTNDQRLSFLLTLGQELVLIEVAKGVENLLKETRKLDEIAETVVASGPKVPLVEQAAAIEKAISKAKHPLDLAAPIHEFNMGDRVKDPRYADVQHGLVSYFLARWAGRQKEGRKLVGLKLQSELVFRGSVLLEAYVQRRVQQILDYSLDEIAQEFFDESIGVESSERHGAGVWRRRFNRALGRTFDHWFDDLWSRLITDQVLVAKLGREVIRLGRDIPLPPDQGQFFPEELDRIDDQWTRNLLLRFDHSFGTGAGTASENWAIFDDRMSFLVNVIRSRQKAIGLWHEPFTVREEVLVRAGQDPTDVVVGG